MNSTKAGAGERGMKIPASETGASIWPGKKG